MKILEISQMENLKVGKNPNYGCSYFTGTMCVATIGLLGSAVFAPLAGATGFACGLGIISGCAS